MPITSQEKMKKLIFAAFLLWTNVCVAEVLVKDGDSLEVDGVRVRLDGIDAPEFLQTCEDKNGADYECGQESLQHLQELIANISHDLRTPLTGIIGNSSLFLENQERLSVEEQREIVENIYNDSDWLLNMVENLLTITRIQGDYLSITTSDESVEEVISEA